MTRRPPFPSDAGFSLIEAAIMLAVAGMALMLIFAVATRSSQQGFRLGRNALAVADRELADDASATWSPGWRSHRRRRTRCG
jgi:hypothetical protein